MKLMHPPHLRKILLALVLAVIVGAAASWVYRIEQTSPAQWQSDTIALVLPDDLSEANRLFASAWLDGAAEEGVRLEAVSRRSFHGADCKANGRLPEQFCRTPSIARSIPPSSTRSAALWKTAAP